MVLKEFTSQPKAKGHSGQRDSLNKAMETWLDGEPTYQWRGFQCGRGIGVRGGGGRKEARQCPPRHLYPEPKNRDILKQMNSRNIMEVRDESRKNSWYISFLKTVEVGLAVHTYQWIETLPFIWMRKLLYWSNVSLGLAMEKKMIALIGRMDFVLKEGYVNENTFWGSNQYWNWVIKPEETVLFPNFTSVIFLQLKWPQTRKLH